MYFGNTLLLITILVVNLWEVRTVQFHLPAHYLGNPLGERCLFLYIAKDSMVSGKFVVKKGSNQRISIEVRDHN